MSRRLLALCLAIALAACSFAPKYTRPGTDAPADWRGVPARSSASLADLAWWQVFDDPALQALIGVALEQNKEVQVAAARIAQARAVLGVKQADQWPDVFATGSARRERWSAKTYPAPPPPLTHAIYDVGLNAAFEVDLWGRLRNSTAAARADLLATEEARRTIVISLVADVALAYFELRALDQDLAIARHTAETRAESLRIVQRRFDRGISSELDRSLAQRQYQGALAAIPVLERRIAESENRLSVLLGRNPGGIARGIALAKQPLPPDVPAGLPSALLERRPDLQQAEQLLIAANARVGEARALYFPRIALTGDFGYQSVALSDLLTTPANFWQVGASFAQPVFDAGRITSRVDLAKAQKDEAALRYQQAALQAFREVDDALFAYRKTREGREVETRLVATARQAFEIAQKRYAHGLASYLEVLDAQRELFNAELALTRTQREQLSALVQLYRALGGGWTAEAGAMQASAKTSSAGSSRTSAR